MNTIHSILKQYPVIEKVILFGSRSVGNHSFASDVDIALVGNIPDATILKINYLLNEETCIPFFFDLTHLPSITNKNLLKEIQEKGTTIYQKRASYTSI